MAGRVVLHSDLNNCYASIECMEVTRPIPITTRLASSMNGTCLA